MRIRILLLTLVGALILAACGGEPATTVLEGQDVTLKMFDNRYEYNEVHIPVGGSIEFLAAGRNPHNAVAADGTWSTEEEFGDKEMLEGDSALISFDTAGTYVFYCTFHGNAEGAGMAGTVIVGDSG